MAWRVHGDELMVARMPDAGVVISALTAHYSGSVDVHVFDQLDSTSSWLSAQRASVSNALAQGQAQLCVTDWQQAGVGRRGKSWQTQAGNVTFSVLARYDQPAQRLLGLSLVTGIAVAEALDDAFGLNVKLKWPNDVILDNCKLGGLLTEVVTVPSSERHASTTVSDVITGIGINVIHDESVTRLGIGATSLTGGGIDVQPLDRDALVGSIGAAVLASHQRFLDEGWTAFAQRWAARDWLMDNDIVIHKEHMTEHAIARGVNEQGALLVESAGKLQPLYGGNVSIRRSLASS